MNKKVEAYFLRIEDQVKGFQIHPKKREELYRLLGTLKEMDILGEEEQEYWIRKLSSNLLEEIEILGLSARAYHALDRAGIKNCGQLREGILCKDLLGIRNIGTLTAAEIINKAMKKNIITKFETYHAHNSIAWNKVLVTLELDIWEG